MLDRYLHSFHLSKSSTINSNPITLKYQSTINVLSMYYVQIEGAFVQGLGWVALEELKWGDKAHKWIPSGNLFTTGPGNYKIPSVNDVPLKFSVSLLKVCT